MNKTAFIKELNKLIGKKVDSVFGIQWDIEKAFKSALEEEGFGDYSKEITCYKVSAIEYNVNYKTLCVCTVSVHKKKGDSHYSWYSSSHTDYFYKEFIINENYGLKDFDFASRVVEIERYLRERANAKERDYADGYELYKKIRALLPNEKDYTIASRLRYVLNHWYDYDKDFNGKEVK